MDNLAAIATIVSGIGAIWAAYAGLRSARARARALCDDELDRTRQRLAAARQEAEALAGELHTLRMRR